MIHLTEFNKFRQKYSSIQYEPLEITAVYKTGASRQNYNQQTLDNLLASQVVRLATNGNGLANNKGCYDIPLPLKCLWRNRKGYPLWAASYFWPDSETYQWSMVQHKRAIDGKWSKGRGKNKKLAINKASGKHKEKRIPVPAETSVTGKYSATCIGNAEEILALLENITMMSGRRGVGLGAIDYFKIRQIHNANVFIRDNFLSRAIPEEAIEFVNDSGYQIYDDPVDAVGWTPPQWKPTLFGKGWFAGTLVDIL